MKIYRNRHGQPVSEDEAVDEQGTIRDGFGLAVSAYFMDATQKAVAPPASPTPEDRIIQMMKDNTGTGSLQRNAYIARLQSTKENHHVGR